MINGLFSIALIMSFVVPSGIICYIWMAWYWLDDMQYMISMAYTMDVTDYFYGFLLYIPCVVVNTKNW